MDSPIKLKVTIIEPDGSVLDQLWVYSDAPNSIKASNNIRDRLEKHFDVEEVD